MSQTYSLAEVATHNTKGNLWLAINGKVYDVSNFAQDHPGGEDAIFEEAGKDATDVFNDIGHSEYAIEQLNDFYIGDVEGAKTVEVVPVAVPVPEKKSKGSALRVIIPTVIIAGILVYKFVLAPRKH